MCNVLLNNLFRFELTIITKTQTIYHQIKTNKCQKLAAWHNEFWLHRFAKWNKMRLHFFYSILFRLLADPSDFSRSCKIRPDDCTESTIKQNLVLFQKIFVFVLMWLRNKVRQFNLFYGVYYFLNIFLT